MAVVTGCMSCVVNVTQSVVWLTLSEAAIYLRLDVYLRMNKLSALERYCIGIARSSSVAFSQHRSLQYVGSLQRINWYSSYS